jgi:hypothetical protein
MTCGILSWPAKLEEGYGNKQAWLFLVVTLVLPTDPDLSRNELKMVGLADLRRKMIG